MLTFFHILNISFQLTLKSGFFLQNKMHTVYQVFTLWSLIVNSTDLNSLVVKIIWILINIWLNRTIWTQFGNYSEFPNNASKWILDSIIQQFDWIFSAMSILHISSFNSSLIGHTLLCQAIHWIDLFSAKNFSMRNWTLSRVLFRLLTPFC